MKRGGPKTRGDDEGDIEKATYDECIIIGMGQPVSR